MRHVMGTCSTIMTMMVAMQERAKFIKLKSTFSIGNTILLILIFFIKDDELRTDDIAELVESLIKEKSVVPRIR